MNDATDTPMTDRNEYAGSTFTNAPDTVRVVHSDFARQLERELNEAKKALENSKAYKRVMKEYNQRMRKEMQDAFQMLRVLSDNLMDDGPTWPRVLEWLTRNEKFKPETK